MGVFLGKRLGWRKGLDTLDTLDTLEPIRGILGILRNTWMRVEKACDKPHIHSIEPIRFNKHPKLSTPAFHLSSF